MHPQDFSRMRTQCVLAPIGPGTEGNTQVPLHCTHTTTEEGSRVAAETFGEFNCVASARLAFE